MKKFEELKTILSCNLNDVWAVYGDKEPCVTIESRIILALLADREQLREALKFLRDNRIHDSHVTVKAREALKKSDEVENG